MDKFKNFNKSILYCIFNRIECTKKSFESIRKIKPSKLFIAADGPRQDIKGENIRVQEVINYVENHIDWECEIYKNYSHINLGSRERISTAISWALNIEEDIIILEDDIVPTDDFFIFCEKMLDYYKENEKIMMVSGMNYIKKYKSEKPYFFSCFPLTWGWATWRRAWIKYDDDMKEWPSIKKSGTLKYIAPWPSRLLIFWNYKYAYKHEMKAWDFVWHYTMMKNNGFGIVPRENLVTNCGFDSELATNTTGKCKYDFTYEKMEFPLKINDDIIRNKKYDKIFIQTEFNKGKALFILSKKLLFFIPRRIIKSIRRK